MLKALAKVAKKLPNRWHLVKRYHRIYDSKLHGVLFFFLPSKLAHLYPMCQFRMGNMVFKTRRCDLLAVNEVALRGEYNFIYNLVKRPDPIILDLGANIGLFAILAFNMFPYAKCHSFEASSDTFRILKLNRQLNPNFQWDVYHEAVWKEEGSVWFQTTGMSWGRRIAKDQNNCEEVQSTKLSNIIKRCGGKVSICKMDIEGAEEAVLQSCIETLRLIDNLIVEIHPDFCSEDRVIRMLRLEFDHLYEVSGRGSKKPLVLASRDLYNLGSHSYLCELKH